ncbi:hypothetical protein GCM10009837_28850 [Streptomyces durmitorensis]|uniref:AAA family ATPase n=1 Tax=Streptomyces durmitorensis TaxID=319947 RepID=A0ABY4PZ00_9ACTN|nr:AAA family ATPase [Streptomyces durmitorensis]UQT58657.1 AAA family ATPase [Streptomyces durmitorensis]
MTDLRLITGAPGAGKSTLLAHLRHGRHGPFTVVDFDELPDPDGHLLGIEITSPAASAVWPAYNRLWVRVASMLTRGGRPVLVTCPLTPAEWEAAAAGVTDAPKPQWARLDCEDRDRRARLTARGWHDAEIEEALQDARELRDLIGTEFSTSGRAPSDTASAVAAWLRDGSAP